MDPSGLASCNVSSSDDPNERLYSSIVIPSIVLVQPQISTSYKPVKHRANFHLISKFMLMSQITEKVIASQLIEHSCNNLSQGDLPISI